jgi:NADH:ubiquinone oxidoreductase subunit
LVGIDRFGNKYFENMEEELPRMLRIVRTRWVDYKEAEYEP